MNIELGQNVLPMGSRGIGADAQTGGGFVCAQALHQEREEFLLPAGQQIVAGQFPGPEVKFESEMQGIGGLKLKAHVSQVPPDSGNADIKLVRYFFYQNNRHEGTLECPFLEW